MKNFSEIIVACVVCVPEHSLRTAFNHQKTSKNIGETKLDSLVLSGPTLAQLWPKN